MNTRSIRRLFVILLLAILAMAFPRRDLLAQTNTFTYQGQLLENGAAANGLYDFLCEIYDQGTSPGGNQVASSLTLPAVQVANGLFSLNLDFGPGVFNGQPRWLAIAVKGSGGREWTSLAPRQQIMASPYAQFAFSGNPGPQGPAGPPGPQGPAGPGGDSHWLLNGASIYYNSGNVGIGTSSPAWPLHIASGQAVVRMDSSSSAFGSVIEMRNNAASPTYLGALNFNNTAGTYPGQIGYLATHDMIFRTAGAERMRISGEGRVDLSGPDSSVAINSSGNIFNIPFGRAISATSDGPLSMAVAAKSDLGNAIHAQSSSGFAGTFLGPVRVNYASPFDKPQLALTDPSDNGFARLRLQTGDRPMWDIALGTGPGATNTLRFYSEGNGDVVTITPQGTLFTRVLTITGGADISEPFEMSEPDLKKGAVVVIDEDVPGQLKLSKQAYDRRVAGIISGAGGVNPGLSLSQQGVLSGGQQVALTGRVYVQADASSGAIRPGDLLTTSDFPGHAMRVQDHSRAPGAVLGKAMTGLKEDRGLVLVLVTLQ